MNLRDLSSFPCLLSILLPTVLSQGVTSSDGFIEKLLAENRNPLQEYMGGGLFECSLDYMRTMIQIKAHLRKTQERKELLDEAPMSRGFPQQFAVMVPVELSTKLMAIMDSCDRLLLLKMATAKSGGGNGGELSKLLLQFHEPAHTEVEKRRR